MEKLFRKTYRIFLEISQLYWYWHCMPLFSIRIGLCSRHHRNRIRDEMLSDPRSWDISLGTDSWRCGHQRRVHIELRNHIACLDKGRFALHIKETISTVHALSTHHITSLFRKPFTIKSYVFNTSYFQISFDRKSCRGKE